MHATECSVHERDANEDLLAEYDRTPLANGPHFHRILHIEPL